MPRLYEMDNEESAGNLDSPAKRGAGMTIESVSRWVKAKNLFSIDIIQKGVHLYPLNREYRAHQKFECFKKYDKIP